MPVWGGVLLNCSRGQVLIKLQKRIVKNLFTKHSHENSCLFKQFKLLKIIDIYKLYCSIHMFRLLVLNQNPHLQNNIIINHRHHEYDTRNRNLLVAPFPRVDAIKYNFQFQFVDIWNQVPDAIKQCISLRNFKRHYIQHLLDSY